MMGTFFLSPWTVTNGMVDGHWSGHKLLVLWSWRDSRYFGNDVCGQGIDDIYTRNKSMTQSFEWEFILKGVSVFCRHSYNLLIDCWWFAWLHQLNLHLTWHNPTIGIFKFHGKEKVEGKNRDLEQIMLEAMNSTICLHKLEIHNQWTILVSFSPTLLNFRLIMSE